MKEAYEAPEITRIEFASADILTSSPDEGEWDFNNQQNPGFPIML